MSTTTLPTCSCEWYRRAHTLLFDIVSAISAEDKRVSLIDGDPDVDEMPFLVVAVSGPHATLTANLAVGRDGEIRLFGREIEVDDDAVAHAYRTDRQFTSATPISTVNAATAEVMGWTSEIFSKQVEVLGDVPAAHCDQWGCRAPEVTA